MGSRITSWPETMFLSLPGKNLEMDQVHPFSRASFADISNFLIILSKEVPWMYISSTCLSNHSPRLEKNLSVLELKPSPALLSPCGALRKQYLPNSLMKVGE